MTFKEDFIMSKIFKRLTSIAMAGVMAINMTIPASADCSHGNYQIRTGEPKFGGRYTHMHNGVECTVTNYVAVITTFCGYCGHTIHETSGTVRQDHSYRG